MQIIRLHIFRLNFDYDKDRNNICIDDGSVCATTYKSGEDNAPKEWTDGVVAELAICENYAEINYNAIHFNKKFARGYVLFKAISIGRNKNVLNKKDL